MNILNISYLYWVCNYINNSFSYNYVQFTIVISYHFDYYNFTYQFLWYAGYPVEASPWFL